MVDDSQVPFRIRAFPDGIFDAPVDAEDIPTIGTVVYISGNRLVKKITADDVEADVRQALGRITSPYVDGQNNVVPVLTQWRRLEEFVAGETIAAGLFVKYEYGAGAINGQVIVWVPGTDDADQIVGQCWNGGDDTDTVEIFTR
jgi:hypothetical protein